jgi:uncharacterized lipoprotein NlpE involved in copper resistance
MIKKRKTSISVFLMMGLLVSCTQNEKKNGPETKKDSTSTVVKNSAQEPENIKNSLNWVGTYEGTLPCASCEGIKTTITLNKDNTFNITTEYLGDKDNKFNDKGVIEWDSTGSVITLKSGQESWKYKLSENQLVHLDIDGKEIDGKMKSMYILMKK